MMARGSEVDHFQPGPELDGRTGKGREEEQPRLADQTGHGPGQGSRPADLAPDAGGADPDLPLPDVAEAVAVFVSPDTNIRR